MARPGLQIVVCPSQPFPRERLPLDMSESLIMAGYPPIGGHDRRADSMRKYADPVVNPNFRMMVRTNCARPRISGRAGIASAASGREMVQIGQKREERKNVRRTRIVPSIGLSVADLAYEI